MLYTNIVGKRWLTCEQVVDKKTMHFAARSIVDKPIISTQVTHKETSTLTLLMHRLTTALNYWKLWIKAIDTQLFGP